MQHGKRFRICFRIQQFRFDLHRRGGLDLHPVFIHDRDVENAGILEICCLHGRRRESQILFVEIPLQLDNVQSRSRGDPGVFIIADGDLIGIPVSGLDHFFDRIGHDHINRKTVCRKSKGFPVHIRLHILHGQFIRLCFLHKMENIDNIVNIQICPDQLYGDFHIAGRFVDDAVISRVHDGDVKRSGNSVLPVFRPVFR